VGAREIEAALHDLRRVAGSKERSKLVRLGGKNIWSGWPLNRLRLGRWSISFLRWEPAGKKTRGAEILHARAAVGGDDCWPPMIPIREAADSIAAGADQARPKAVNRARGADVGDE